MMSSYTSRTADLPFPLEFLVSYDTTKFLMTSANVAKISHFLVGLHLGIYWVLWVQLTTLCPFKFW